MNLMKSSRDIEVLVTAVPPEAKGGIAGLHQVLFESLLPQKVNLIPFPISSSNPFGEKNISRLFRILKKSFSYIFRLFLYKSIRVVHINSAPDSKAILRDSLFVLLGWMLRRKIVLQIHGAIGEIELPKFIVWIAKKIFPLCSKILVFSKKDLKRVLEISPGSDVEQFPNGIKVLDFQSNDMSLKRELSIEEENHVVLFLSRIIREKGIFDIIESIPDIIKQSEKVTFIFAGTGPDKDKAEELCVERRLDNWVKFTGHLEYRDVLRAFACSDIFVLPTFYIEGMPMAVLQAMASGLPIISTQMGSIPEIVENNFNGFIIEAQKPEKIAEKIIYLLEDKHIRDKMGENNIQLAMEKFDSRIVLGKLEDIYCESLLSHC